LDNLEWTTKSDNTFKAYRVGLMKPCKRSVRQYALDGTFIAEFDSVKTAAASDAASLFSTSISACINRRPSRKTHAGFIWRAIDDDDLFRSTSWAS
jgi:hypothetical protein